MTRIGNSDQILRLLREQLKRADKTSGARKKDAAGRTDALRERPLDRVRQLTGAETLSDQDVRRAIVRGLLTEQFGDAITNDPAFLTVAADVARMIDATPEGRGLIDRALASLRGGTGSV
jgi:hypothetical protein